MQTPFQVIFIMWRKAFAHYHHSSQTHMKNEKNISKILATKHSTNEAINQSNSLI